MPDDSELPESAGVDPWSTHLSGQELVPAYLTSRFAAQYRVVVDVLFTEQDTSLTGSSFDDISGGVRSYLNERVDPEVAERLFEAMNLEQRLAQLEAWGVVTRWQQPARTGEDFLRRRDRYQLTPRAAQLHAFWREAAAEEEDVGGLTLVPRIIHDRLIEFRQAVRTEHFDSAAAIVQDLSALHHAMAKAARIWQRTLAHALAGVPGPAKQELLWTTLQSYVAAWGEQVDVHSPAIADLTTELTPELTDRIWHLLARASFTDSGSDEVIAASADRWRRTWTALRLWFTGPDGQARRLRRQLRDVVAPWARNMHILMDTGGTVTRRAELLGLATAIERAPDDEAAWRLWDTAVAAFSARHWLLPAPAAEDDTLSWPTAPSAPVTVRFREQGSRAAVGRRARTPDYTKGREAARRARIAAAAERREAEASLRQRSGSRLATWPRLSNTELSVLLEFVGAARRGTRQGGCWESATADGRWLVRLEAPTSAEDTAVVAAPCGCLVIADWRFVMEPA